MMKLSVPMFVVVVAMAGCKLPHTTNLPPAERMMHPGPGVDGPGPGVMMQAPPPAPGPAPASQVLFVGPAGMIVNWDIAMPNQFDSEPLYAPGRANFPQGAIYRLRIRNIPGREEAVLYPTLEIAPAMPRTTAFLAHNAIPVQLTEEDLDQVMSNNFVTKVIYLPDKEFQELAIGGGVETLVSTRLDPGQDPIIEADRKGSILAVLRLGNKDLKLDGQGMEQGGVIPASYGMAAGCPPMGPQGAPLSGPTGYIAGMTTPQYGMPMCGTPIGLPGPPHVPLGGPAGLQKHVIRNHTYEHYPSPTKHIKIDVRQDPGFSYPKPANHAWIVEQTVAPPAVFHQPGIDQRQVIRPTQGYGECEAGGSCEAYPQ